MIGEKLSERYELLSELGRGGMGVVYRAHDPLLDREVAVKLVAPELLNPETEQRFKTEARLVAQMDHPAIVSIHDLGLHQGSMFFVMPIVEGRNLRDYLREGSLRLGMVVDIGIEVAQALDYSHARGVIHRDIKPENIMVTTDDAGGVRVRVMDFGLARGTNVSSLTRTGMLMGTMSYISPEQVVGGDIDGRADIYSLGSVLYECLANEVPFGGEMQAVLYRISHELPQPPRALGADVDEELEQVVLRCLAKKPEERPQSAAELAGSLRRYRTKMKDSQRLLSVMKTQAMVQSPRPALGPFIGRDQEFGRLQQSLNAALAGECQFVTVSGEAGVGKTRLLDELENLAMARDIRVLHGRFVEESGAFPYHGFCEAIQEFFRQKESGRPSSGLPDLGELAGDLIALFPMLSEIEFIRTAAGGSSGGTTAAQTQLPENRTQIFELLARTLTLLAAGRPLVLLLEDLQGADVSVEALQYIVRRLGPTPTLIVGTYRTTEVDKHHPLWQLVDSFAGDRRFASLSLEPLSRADHRSFVETLTGGARVAEELSRRLFEATEGNPFFTKEIVRSLVDSGGIAQDETGAWSLSGGMEISAETLPATIQQAVERRIGDLPDELRRVLAIAAVMGKSFDYEDLEALAGGGDELDDAVDRFVREGLLEEDRRSRGDRLSFSSAVLREVLYGELPRRKRRSLHRKYAAVLEKRYAGRLERIYPQLVWHFSEGDVPDKTVEYGLLLAEQSLNSFSAEEAIRAAKVALEFLDEDWEGDAAVEGEARLLLANAHRVAGNVAGAIKEAAAAIKVFERSQRPGRAVAAVLVAARSAWKARQADETRQWVERGIEAARAAGETASLEELLALASTVANLRGDYEQGKRYLDEAEALRQDTEVSEAGEEVPDGGRLIVALGSPVHARKPADVQIIEEREVYSNVFETLLGTGESGNLLPGLADEWEVLEGGRSVRLRIRSGIRFHDGELLTAAHVKDSFEAAVRAVPVDQPPALAAIEGAEALLAGTAEEISGVQVIDDDRLEIRLTEELPVYPALLTDVCVAITRESAAAGGGPALGTGPFRIASHEPEQILLERVTDYWRGDPAHLDELEFRTLPSAAAIARGLRAGEIDLARDLLPEDLETLLRDPRFRRGLVESAQKITYFVLFNSKAGPSAADQRLRRALAGVLRTQDLVWRTLGRFAQPATGLIPPGILGHDAGRRPRTLSADAARKLLREAGVENGCELRGAVHPLIRDRYGGLVEELFSAWRDLGVAVAVEEQDMASFLRLLHRSDGLDFLITRWMLDYDDPDNFTHTLFHSVDGIYKQHFSSTAGDALLEEGRTEARPGRRQAIYRKFEEHLTESAAVVPLFHDIGYRMASPRVVGIQLGSVPPYVNYAGLGKRAAAAPAVVSERGGTIHIPMTARIPDLDPFRQPTREDTHVRFAFLETLTKEVGDARIKPWLARSVEAEQGGRRYRLRLRQDVRFHDGRRLTARDVRYSFEELLRRTRDSSSYVTVPILGAGAVLAGEADELAGVQIHSEAELTFELEEPVAYFPALLSTPVLPIVPEGSRGSGRSWRDGAVGSGPFRVAAFASGERLELERNPQYWRPGLPKVDRLEFLFAVPPDEIAAGFRDGRFTLASDLFPADADALRRDPLFARGYRDAPALITYFMAFHLHHGPMSDLGLRRRAVAAVDVPRLVRQTLGGLAQPARGLFPPGLSGHDPRWERPLPTPAVGSGAGGSEVEVTAAVHPVMRTEYARFYEILAADLAAAGIHLRPVTDTVEEFLEAVEKASVDLFVGRWHADFPDSDSLANILNRRDGFLGKMSGTEAIDRLIATGRAEVDPQARHAIYRRLEEGLAREAILLPLFHEQEYRFARPEVEGLELTFTSTVAYEQLRLGAS